MPDTVTLPGIGKTQKTTAYMVGGGLVLIVGIAWYRSKNAGAASTSSAPASADTSQIDPATGFAYGSPEDAAALAQQASYVSAGGGVAGGGGSPIFNSGGTTAAAYTTNGQWSQAAEDYLVNTVHSGTNADLIGNALGKYITGQPLTTDQVGIVEQAIAFTGYPPVNGPSGYPPSYRTAATPVPTPTPVPGTPHAPTGLHAARVDRTGISLGWTSVAGARGYTVYLDGKQLQTVTYNSEYVHDLKPGTRHTLSVATLGANGKLSGKSTITVATHK
jgi:hypothetical protein